MSLENKPDTRSRTGGRLAAVLVAARAGDYAQAETMLAGFLDEKFKDLSVRTSTVRIRQDGISLNSVNGTFEDAHGKKYFFKFHMEENESETLKEYYKAELLTRAGYPTELPAFMSTEVGEQILIYPYVDYERLFDASRRNEAAATGEAEEIIAAQQELDRLCAEKCVETLCTGTKEDYAAEALLQLFFWRLADRQQDGSLKPRGGRQRSFYIDQVFRFPDGLKLTYADLARLQWNINGIAYDITLEAAFDQAYRILSPDAAEQYPACTAHGDAHNGNVWVKNREDGSKTLSYFDPAFAGDKIPVLLAEVKPTFHNIFAHPDWLYNARESDLSINVNAEIKGETLYVRHDWSLTKLRQKFLESKQNLFWIPVLKELKRRGVLPGNWEDYVRMALFCCPTLVMNLRAGAGTVQNTHTPQTSLLGLSIAIMCACAPVNGSDPVHRFFTTINQTINE
jgi:hypothetical protein